MHDSTIENKLTVFISSIINDSTFPAAKHVSNLEKSIYVTHIIAIGTSDNLAMRLRITLSSFPAACFY